MRLRPFTCAALVAATAFLTAGGAGHAAFPGKNGKIAFFCDGYGCGKRGLHAMNRDGSGNRFLRLAWSPAWSADGKRLVALTSSPGELIVMDADGRGVRRLGVTGSSPSWSPDGDRIVYSRTGDIYVVDADGQNETRLTEGWDGAPDWSPDGSKIVFARESGRQFDIFVMNADGSDPTALTESPEDDLTPDWSPDGSKIVFVRDRMGDELEEIFVIDADGSNETRLTYSGLGWSAGPAWAPNGRKILFELATFEHGCGLAKMNPDGSNIAMVGGGACEDNTPDWQPLVAGADK